MGAGASRPSFLGGGKSKVVVDSASSNTQPSKSTPAKNTIKDILPHPAFTNGSYTGAPIPTNEPERVGHLCGLGVLDSKPDPRFDSITQLACMIFKVPIALVSLVDSDRQWFKSVQGLDTDHTNRKSSFCAWTLLPEHPEVLVVRDARLDARFANNALVTGPPDIRFYAGSPLVATNDLRMGSLCIIDRVPREFDADACMMLVNLANMVVRELEKDKMLAEQAAKSAVLTQENTQLLRAIDAFSEGIMLCNVSKSEWPVEFINEAFEQMTGFTKTDLGNGFWSFFRIHGDSDLIQAQYGEAIEDRDPFEITVYFMDKLKQKKYLTLNMRCANVENMSDFMPLVGIPAMLPDHGGDDAIMEPNEYYFATVTPQQMSGDPNHVHRSNPFSSSGSSVNGGGSQTNVNRPAFLLVENNDPFGDIKLGQLLGRGSYGRVYRARWNGTLVAVKLLEWVDQVDEGVTGGTKETMEALMSTQLSHPNVVQTYKHFTREVGQNHEGCSMMETWLIMDFCNRGGLSDAVDKGEFRRQDNMFDCDYWTLFTTAKEIASALCYLHSCRLLHGDLTSNNILLTTSDKDKRGFTAKVCDFGLSKTIEGQESIKTHTLGTITHMPPEQISEGTMSMAADVYAFGVIMWEMYMGQRPWMGLSHSQIITAVSSGKQLQLGPNAPSTLKKFVAKCLAMKPAERPTFTQVIKDLEELEEDLVGMVGDL